MKVGEIQNVVYFRMNNIHRCVKKVCKKKGIYRASCKKHYCNPGCTGTMFEKTFKQTNGLHGKNLMMTRKAMFGKNNTVLKNNFYKRLSKKTRNTLKKKGAISGCIEW